MKSGQFLVNKLGVIIDSGDHRKFVVEDRFHDGFTLEDLDDYEKALYKKGYLRVILQNGGHLIIAGDREKIKRFYKKILMSAEIPLRYVSYEAVTQGSSKFGSWLKVEDFVSNLEKI